MTWDLVRGDLPPDVKAATVLEFDRVLGLGLGQWRPPEEEVPGDVVALVDQRQQARAAKRWAEADALREEIKAAGYEVQDTPEGPSLLRLK